MKQNNYGTLCWFDDVKFQHRNKWYEYDHYQPVTTWTNQIPPFQHPLNSDSSVVISFQLVNVEDNEFFEIRNEMEAAGMRLRTYAATDDYPAHRLVVWPAVAKIPGQYKEGVYYAIMRTADKTWYSEHFVMRNHMGDDFIYLEWVHAEKYNLYPQLGHFIDYNGNYKNFLWIKCDIGKPQWFYEEEFEDRDGFPYPVHQVKFKLNQFSIIVSEYYLDILAEIPLHDCVNIIHQGHTYEVDRFIMNQPTWFPQGSLAEVVLQFRYDTTTIVSGRGVISSDCGIGDCFEEIVYNTEAVIEFNSDEYLGAYYLDDNGGQVPFIDGQYSLIDLTEEFGPGVQLARYDASIPVFEVLSPSVSQIAYDKKSKTYWQHNPSTGIWVPFDITSYTQTSVQGTGLDGSTIEVIGIIGTTEVLIGVITIEQFRAGWTFSYPEELDAIKVTASTGLCANFYDSGFHYFDQTEDTPDTPEPDLPGFAVFSDELAASLGGVTPDSIFLQDPDNSTQGLPGCIWRTVLDENGDNPNFPIYDSPENAIELGPNEIFIFSLGNHYGMPPGVLYTNPKGYPVYDSPADAAANGVTTGQPYLLSGRSYGFGRGAFVATMNCTT